MLFLLGDVLEFVKYVFCVFDQNVDGKLDFCEFVCGFSIVLRGCMEDKFKFSFQMYDINGNGFIFCEEMLEVFVVSRMFFCIYFVVLYFKCIFYKCCYIVYIL